MSGRGVGRGNFLDVDSTIGGEGGAVVENIVDVNRRFLWSVVGEDGIGRRGRVGIASFAFIRQRRCGGPRIEGRGIPGHAGANTGVSAHVRELKLVPRSGAKLATVEGIESRNPLPIVFHGLLVERHRPKRVVGWGFAEPVGDRGCVREWFIFEAPNDTEVHDREALERRVRIGSVVVFELLLGTESNFVAIGVGIGDSDVLDRDAVQGLEFRRYFDPRRRLSESDTTGDSVFTELELDGRGHGCG